MPITPSVFLHLMKLSLSSSTHLLPCFISPHHLSLPDVRLSFYLFIVYLSCTWEGRDHCCMASILRSIRPTAGLSKDLVNKWMEQFGSTWFEASHGGLHPPTLWHLGVSRSGGFAACISELAGAGEQRPEGEGASHLTLRGAHAPGSRYSDGKGPAVDDSARCQETRLESQQGLDCQVRVWISPHRPHSQV